MVDLGDNFDHTFFERVTRQVQLKHDVRFILIFLVKLFKRRLPRNGISVNKKRYHQKVFPH